jgi:hypothetical protein
MKPLLVVILATLGTVQAGQITLGQNAILNPGAELGLGSGNGNDIETVPDWTTTGNFTVIAYGSANSEINSAPGPDFGNNFFAGGPNNALSSATQTLDVSNISALIDAGLVDYTLSGYFGGYETQADYATLSATFLDASSNVLGVVTVGGNNEAARNGQTELLYAGTTGMVPDGTESILFTLTMTREEGNYNDGYADNLSFVAVDPPGNAAVPEPSAWLLTGLGGSALCLVRRFRR